MGNASRRRQARRNNPRDLTDLTERFWEQISFIESSSKAYDADSEAEARRIALALRVLLYDSGKSKSILSQLGIIDKVKMLNTAAALMSNNLAPTPGLTAIQISGPSAHIRYVPFLDDHPMPREQQLVSVRRWLKMPIGRSKNESWSRQKLILWVANQDGGAHVDPAMEDLYHELSRANRIGFFATSSDGTEREPSNSYPLAAIRQIGYEMVCTAKRLEDTGLVQARPPHLHSLPGPTGSMRAARTAEGP